MQYILAAMKKKTPHTEFLRLPPKIMPPISLRCPTPSNIDDCSMAVNIEASHL